MIAAATVGEGVRSAAAALAAAGVPLSRLEARLLVGHALRLGPESILVHPERPIAAADHERLAAVVARRVRREPLAHITGIREFWSLPFRVTPETLVPRPDTETVVEAALARLRPKPAPRILDLGTGSGCLLLALLSERPDATGLGVDVSPSALAVAAANARELGLAGRAAFVCADWTAAVTGTFEAIVANPPYIPTRALADLEPEVGRYEPRGALDGGADGLRSYRAILPGLVGHLAHGGFAALEVGADQAAAVAALAPAHGLQVAEIKRDLAGVERCVIMVAASPPPGKKKLGNQPFPD